MEYKEKQGSRKGNFPVSLYGYILLLPVSGELCAKISRFLYRQ